MEIRIMVIDDYAELIELFSSTPGITVRDADSKEMTKKYLERNNGMSYVALENNKIIGCAMAGHDGRRGYLQHVVVKEEYRKQGIGELLVGSCIEALAKSGIYKTHLFVMKNNEIGYNYWKNRNWVERNDIFTFSFTNSENKNV